VTVLSCQIGIHKASEIPVCSLFVLMFELVQLILVLVRLHILTRGFEPGLHSPLLLSDDNQNRLGHNNGFLGLELHFDPVIMSATTVVEIGVLIMIVVAPRTVFVASCALLVVVAAPGTMDVTRGHRRRGG